MHFLSSFILPFHSPLTKYSIGFLKNTSPFYKNRFTLSSESLATLRKERLTALSIYSTSFPPRPFASSSCSLAASSASYTTFGLNYSPLSGGLLRLYYPSFFFLTLLFFDLTRKYRLLWELTLLPLLREIRLSSIDSFLSVIEGYH